MPAERVSIFNHVLGPVMRGPSSSHTAAALRIAQYLLPFAHGALEKVSVQYDPNGSLATTAGPQGSNMGLAAGFLGFSCADDNMPDSLRLIESAGITFQTTVAPIPRYSHPNTYKLDLTLKSGRSIHAIAISTGGGAIQIASINGFQVDDPGTSHCAFFEIPAADEEEFRKEFVQQVSLHTSGHLIQLRRHEKEPDGNTVAFRLASESEIDPANMQPLIKFARDHSWAIIPCVMPVPIGSSAKTLFGSVAEMKAWMQSSNGATDSLWEAAARYESALTGLSVDDILVRAEDLVEIYQTSVEAGLQGTQYADRILGPQSLGLQKRLASNAPMLNLGSLNTVIAYVSSYMEVKSSFGLIIAGPTAGSCACVPGCLLGFGRALQKTKTELAKSLLICGLIGALIATKSTFAAEEGGCQAECGAAGAMASAGLVYLLDGTARESIVAASLTLQSLLGIVCDPVGNRVEAPCLTRNIAAAAMAASSANLAVAGYSSVIPFDEVLAAHWEVCQAMPRSLRCTGLGGLAAQPSARKIEQELKTCGHCSSCQTSHSSVW